MSTAEEFLALKTAELTATFNAQANEQGTVPGTEFIPMLSTVGFQFSESLWEKIKRMSLMDTDLENPYDEPFYLDDLIEAFEFLDLAIRQIYVPVATSPLEVVPDEKVVDLLKVAGYTLADESAMVLVKAAEREEGIDMEGWIKILIFVRYAMDAFWSRLSLLEEEGADSLPFESMTEIFEWMKVEITSPEEAKAKFEEIDDDGNGTIDIDEFLAFMVKLKYP